MCGDRNGSGRPGGRNRTGTANLTTARAMRPPRLASLQCSTLVGGQRRCYDDGCSDRPPVRVLLIVGAVGGLHGVGCVAQATAVPRRRPGGNIRLFADSRRRRETADRGRPGRRGGQSAASTSRSTGCAAGLGAMPAPPESGRNPFSFGADRARPASAPRPRHRVIAPRQPTHRRLLASGPTADAVAGRGAEEQTRGALSAPL